MYFIYMDPKYDQEILGFNFNQPKKLSTLSFNTVNQQHTPLGFETDKSTPASGNYNRTIAQDINLKPAPRSQLGVPTNKIYRGDTSKFYVPILDNLNFRRGGDFSVHYPYPKAKPFVETVAIPSVVPTPADDPVDYLGSNAKIVIRNNDPFYPYPSQHLLENKNYWAYNHENKYLNDQPIYNYPYGKMEGVSRGKYKGGKGYNPYLVEGFSGEDMGRNRWIMMILIVIVLLIYFCYYKLK